MSQAIQNLLGVKEFDDLALFVYRGILVPGIVFLIVLAASSNFHKTIARKLKYLIYFILLLAFCFTFNYLHIILYEKEKPENASLEEKYDYMKKCRNLYLGMSCLAVHSALLWISDLKREADMLRKINEEKKSN